MKTELEQLRELVKVFQSSQFASAVQDAVLTARKNNGTAFGEIPTRSAVENVVRRVVAGERFDTFGMFRRG
jgi:hypothetical protein